MCMRLRSHAMELQNILRVFFGGLTAFLFLLLLPAASHAWQANEEPAITLDANEAGDAAIEQRLERIYAELPALQRVDVSVRQGVVFLTGETATDAAGDRAVSIARRVSGVVTVEDGIERTLDIEGNVSPFVLDTQQFLTRLTRSWPVYAIVLAVFCVILLAGHFLASWRGFWNRVAPNPFLGRLLAQTVRVIAFAVAIFAALGMLGATALLGALAGVAGIIGLALGFAVRDTIENYIASILLSIRQPFRARDHVVINEREGIVVRLTSRATVLMTLDGNHLRIPNAEVFKGIILNYTRNPERRFEFELGVDAEDDPVAAMDVGLKAISRLDFVLDDPGPDASIVKVGDSSIVLKFTGWVDQTHTDFLKARSLAIRAAKAVIEEEGFTLPEPIYRLRFDEPVAEALQSHTSPPPASPRKPPAKRAPPPVESESTDVTPDRYLDRKVDEERSEQDKEDLLDHKNPVE